MTGLEETALGMRSGGSEVGRMLKIPKVFKRRRGCVERDIVAREGTPYLCAVQRCECGRELLPSWKSSGDLRKPSSGLMSLSSKHLTDKPSSNTRLPRL